MATDAVIAGGGFGGLYAARRLERRLPRPSDVWATGDPAAVPDPAKRAARRMRLAIDWAVGLVFGRASAELGRLGHPPSLGDYLEELPQPEEAPGE